VHTQNRPAGTLLIANHHAEARELLEDMLRKQGYRVLAASDGDEALLLLERQLVDLVLLDTETLGHAGYSLCRTIKERAETRLTPVVLVGAIGDATHRMHGIEAGVDDFLTKPVKREELIARVKSLVRLKHYTDALENAENVVCTLAGSIEAKDPYTVGHCGRLSRYSVTLARQMGLSENECVALRRGGIVHDIGKVAVPDRILLKPGPLDPEERRVMERHPVIGEQICAPLKSLQSVLPIIRWHHERQDGSGYPDGLKGNAIPLTARILQTVDIYDALTTDRPYRKALTREHALSILREEARRGWWDANLIDALNSMLHSTRVTVPAA
jgi:putative two-component system response regulator